jgi:flagellar basal-body rod modification protein FlgD
MMDVSSATSTASSPQSATRKAALNYDSFLRLLIAQMKNQDPTEPKDSSQYLSQLAAFSSVEQTVSTNQKLDQLMAAMQVNQSASFIGRTVTSADGTVSGVVKSVTVSSSGLTAALADGRTLDLSSGIRIE